MPRTCLFHDKVSANGHFANRLPVPRDIDEIFAVGLIDDAGAVGGVVAVSLPGHELCAFFQREGEP